MTDRIKDIELMKKSWSDRVPRSPEKTGESAVLIPLIYSEDKSWEILFERRALDLDVQPGDICLPGGRVETGEEPLEAALRETAEELLVPVSSIEMLGPADKVLGPGQRIIHPFAGIIEGYEGTFSKEEVHETFSISVEWFRNNPPKAWQTSLENIPPEDFPYDLIYGGRNYKFRKRKHNMYFYENGERTVWGATAAIVRNFISMYEEIFGWGNNVNV